MGAIIGRISDERWDWSVEERLPDWKPAMPKQRPGKSEQTVGTPRAFIDAVEKRFGKLRVDLAALPENSKAPLCITPEMDSLKQDWNQLSGNLWLNPPYAKIGDWVAKCAEYHGDGRILVLVPASISTNWFEKHVFGKARIIALKGRLTFEGHTASFPKDLMLLVYDVGEDNGFEVWDWRKE